jgi:hypothetical protein
MQYFGQEINPVLAGLARCFVYEGTYLHGYNTIMADEDAMGWLIEWWPVYMLDGEDFLDHVLQLSDLADSDNQGLYEAIVCMDNVQYKHKEDDPEYVSTAHPCPHCGKAIRIGLGRV